jgi:hypothetical protein
MNRLGVWGLEVTLLLVVGSATALAADPAGGSVSNTDSSVRPEAQSWFERWFGPPKRPVARQTAAVRPTIEKHEPPAKPAAAADQGSDEREKEVQALMRRQMVCLKLMEIALDSHDDELLRKAEKLDARARSVYSQRTVHLPCCRNVYFESDEKTLDKCLGPTDTVTRRAARGAPKRPAASQPASQARIQEEQP